VKHIDLTPAYRVRARQLWRAGTTWIGIAVLVAVCFATAGSVIRSGMSQPARAIASDAQALNVQSDQLTLRSESLGVQLLQTRRLADARRAAGSSPPWHRLLTALAMDMDQRVVLERMELRPRFDEGDTLRLPDSALGYDLDLIGWALDQRRVSGLLLDLEQTGCFDRVQLQQSGRRAFEDRMGYSFRITASMSLQEDRP
jgi:hypothetical protein